MDYGEAFRGNDKGCGQVNCGELRLIDSPVLGPISVKELSGVVKTLILMAFDESNKIFNASACGDNCAKWILKIGQQKDLTINLRHIMDFGKRNFRLKF